MAKRYRIWFKNKKFPYEVGVGNNKREALKWAKDRGRIGNKRIEAITFASR